jgi:glycosyltransferase involved in cell wall biosynthesis
MNVLFWGTYYQNYPRNDSQKKRLRLAGYSVRECHVPIWGDITQRTAIAKKAGFSPHFLVKLGRAYWQLIARHKEIQSADIVWVGYPGHFDIFVLAILNLFYQKKVVWDFYMSLYLITQERQNPLHFLFWLLEWFACRIPNLLIQDTKSYEAWLRSNYHLANKQILLIPLGADDEIWYPVASSFVQKNVSSFRVLYYGSFLKNHGLEYVVYAAKQLAHAPIQFTFVGNGPEYPKIKRLVAELDLRNIEFINWMSQTELNRFASQFDLVLGSFGDTTQSNITIHNKIFESLAMQKPICTRESVAINEHNDLRDGLILCEHSSPLAIVSAIQYCWSNLEAIAQKTLICHLYFEGNFSMKVLTTALKLEIERL